MIKYFQKLIINKKMILLFILFALNVLYSLTFNNIILFYLINGINIIIFDLIFYYIYSKHIKLFTLNLFLCSFYFYEEKFLFTKLILTSYFFTFIYNSKKTNKIIEITKYFSYIFLFEDNQHKIFLNDHLLILYFLSIISIQLSKIYTIIQIAIIFQFNGIILFIIFLHKIIMNKYIFSNVEIFINDFCIIFLYYIKYNIFL
jgi:hypothetical protein